MRPLILPQLERYLLKATDILRGKLDAGGLKDFLFGMLFRKQAADQFESLREETIAEQQKVPDRSPEQVERRAYSSGSYAAPSIFVPDDVRCPTLHDQQQVSLC